MGTTSDCWLPHILKSEFSVRCQSGVSLAGYDRPLWAASSTVCWAWDYGWVSQKTASWCAGWSGRDLSSRWPSACAADSAEWSLQVTAAACRRQTSAARVRPALICLLRLVILLLAQLSLGAEGARELAAYFSAESLSAMVNIRVSLYYHR